MLLVLAPMDGITSCSYRFIVRDVFDKYNIDNEILFVSEFMSSEGFVHNPPGVIKHIMNLEQEKQFIVQIFGGKDKVLLQTLKTLRDNYSFEGIELNMGCPSPKIMSCGGGSNMLIDKEKTAETIKLLSSNYDKKFTIKTRIGLDEKDKISQFNFLLKISEYCDIISIHGRTYKQGHSGDVDWKYIYDLKNEISQRGNNCLVIGNGGIKDFNELDNLIGNLDGLMIGQASIGNPRIFTNHIPNIEDIYNIVCKHLDYLMAEEIYFLKKPFDSYGNLIQPNINDFQEIILNIGNYINEFKYLRSPIEFRKHLFNYIKGIEGNKYFKQGIVEYKDYFNLKKYIDSFFHKLL